MRAPLKPIVSVRQPKRRPVAEAARGHPARRDHTDVTFVVHGRGAVRRTQDLAAIRHRPNTTTRRALQPDQAGERLI
jgi:hypothetical protein